MFPTGKEKPIDVFANWLKEAEQKRIVNHNKVCLATASKDGIPSSRMVLLKDYSSEGFTFYTNTNSHKGSDLKENKNVSLCFYWEEIGKQIRIDGIAEQVSDEEADEYFASRPRQSQLGAWASDQSSELKGGTKELLANVAKEGIRWGIAAVERPPHWTGFRVKPKSIEFWMQGDFRIHKRRKFIFDEDGSYKSLILSP